MAATYQLDGLITGERPTVGAAAQDAWRDWCCEVHGLFGFAFDDDSYRGRLVRQRSSTYQLIGWTSDAETITRSARDTRRDPRGHYELLVPVRGGIRVGQGDDERTLYPGEMALVPFDLPFSVAHASDAAALTLLVPIERVEHRLGSGTGRGYRILGDKGLPRVSRDLIVGVHRERAELSGVEFDSACDRIVDLFCLATEGEDRLPDLSGGAAVLDAVRRYICEHATDFELSVVGMAAAIGWSPRYIQAVLARHGTTPTDLIRSERLDLARTKLANPAFGDQTIAAVASSVGFSSPSAFSSAYRQRFGCSPRDARREFGEPIGDTTTSAPQVLRLFTT